MLIVCAGPDTYRAREKAKMLEAGFCKKYDPQSHAVERIDISKIEHVREQLFPLLSAGTLFSTKKFIRADGCLSISKTPERKILSEKINKTGVDTILVTVEDEAPSQKVLEAFSKEALIVYSFPILLGKDFKEWVSQEAVRRGVSNDVALQISRCTEGDSWLAMSELQKYSANPMIATEGAMGTTAGDAKIFDITDALIERSPGWRARVSTFKDDAVIMMYLSQLRSLVRVQSGHTKGIHPFVQKKMLRVRVRNVTKDFNASLRAFVSRRKGLAEGNEEETLL
ncbi:MAG: hypothetical protein NUV81_03335 [bacterium]|nr:hypothetical protein [bacterium]